MLAASIWSLIIPAIEMTEKQGKIGWISASSGIILGTAFLMITDILSKKSINDYNGEIKNKKTILLTLAIVLHNIPEGMAVRNCFCFMD